MNRQLFQYHPVLGYKFIPNLRTRVPFESGGYLVRTNALGFRSEREFVRDRTPGKKRILLFGDSFVDGYGVSNPQRFSDVVEQSLLGFEVYNYGLTGSGTDQQYLIQREFASEVECDLVVLAVQVANIKRVRAHYYGFADDAGEKWAYAKPYFELKDGGLELFNTPVPPRPRAMADLPPSEQAMVDGGGRFGVARSLVSALGLKDLTQKLIKFQPAPEYGDPASPEWQLTRGIVRTWSGEAKTPFLLVLLPVHQYVEELSEPADYQDRFHELAKECGVAVHDPLTDLQRHPMETRRGFRHKHDTHPSPAGHRAIADSLSRKIATLL